MSINSLIIGGKSIYTTSYIPFLMQENDDIPTLEEIMESLEKLNDDAIALLPEEMKVVISNLFDRNFLTGKAVAYREAALQAEQMLKR